MAMAQKQGIVTEANRDSLRLLAEANLEAATALLDIPAGKPAGQAPETKETPSLIEAIAALKGGQGQAPADPRAAWGYHDWETKDPRGLKRMKAQNPEQFKALQDAYLAS
jgi:hypothetical protein